MIQIRYIYIYIYLLVDGGWRCFMLLAISFHIIFGILFNAQLTGQVGLGVGSWPTNRTTEGSNPKGTRLYFVILLKNVAKIFDWH